MFGHKAPYELAIVSTTVFGTPPGARLHFGDADVVDEDDSDDAEGEQAVQSLDTSCQSSVLGDSMFLPTIAGIDFDPGDDGPNNAGHDIGPGPASLGFGESTLGMTIGVAGEDALTEPKDETSVSSQEGRKKSRRVS